MAKDKLGEYSAKRSFKATPEPEASVPARRDGPLLFVVQQHSARRLHYDFRLECDGVLKSWAVPKGPSLNPAEKRLAVPTEDHPFEYASFEGVIPAGQYGAGEVIVWDCGVYSPDEGEEYSFDDRSEAERRTRQGLDDGKLSFLLRGEKLKGSFALVRTSDKKSWLLIKHKDRFAGTADVTTQDRSVLSGVTVQEIATIPLVRRQAGRRAATGTPRQLGADAGGTRTDRIAAGGLDVGAQAGRLPRPGFHRRGQRQAPLAAWARPCARVSAAERRARQAGGRPDGSGRRDRGIR